MMKFIYITTIIICILFLIVIYFSNVIRLSSQIMYIGSQNNSVSIAGGLFLIILCSFMLGFAVFGFARTFVNKRPKDFDDFDM